MRVGQLRLFFALFPPAAAARRLLAAATALGADGRAVPVTDVHVTLCFLGAVEAQRLEALRSRTARLRSAAFALEFERLEYWRRSRVLVATCAVTPPAAAQLAAQLRLEAPAWRADEQPFRPHATLFRGVSSGCGFSATSLPRTVRLSATRFYLVESREPRADAGACAARYARLASWPLGKAGG